MLERSARFLDQSGQQVFLLHTCPLYILSLYAVLYNYITIFITQYSGDKSCSVASASDNVMSMKEVMAFSRTQSLPDIIWEKIASTSIPHCVSHLSVGRQF